MMMDVDIQQIGVLLIPMTTMMMPMMPLPPMEMTTILHHRDNNIPFHLHSQYHLRVYIYSDQYCIANWNIPFVVCALPGI
jgi:hypothetical protein